MGLNNNRIYTYIHLYDLGYDAGKGDAIRATTLEKAMRCLRSGYRGLTGGVFFAPEFQCCYFCESYFSKIMHL